MILRDHFDFLAKNQLEAQEWQQRETIVKNLREYLEHIINRVH